MKKCLLLTRVSTKYQDFTPQEEDLKKYANELGYEVAHIISTKESGFRSIERKEGFRQVRDFFSSNNDCRTIIITELSRLSRYKSVLEYCREYFEENKIQLIVKDINFQLFNDNGFLNDPVGITFSMFAAIAAAEMAQKRERFQRAKTALREEGYVVGGRPRYGYRIVEVAGKRKTLEIVEKQAEQIRQFFDMYLKGKSIHKVKVECIAKGFDTYFHASTNIQKCLRESAYIGTKTTNNKRKNYQYYELGKSDVDEYITSSYTYNNYPQIVDVDVFNKVQELMTTNCPEKSSRHISILAKLLYVAECDCTLIAEVKKYPDYACKRECKFNHACNKKRYALSMDIVDCVVWDYLKENVELIEQEQLRTLNNESILNLQAEIENIEAKIAEKEKAKAKEVNLYRMDAITETELANRISVIKKDIGSFKSAIKNKQAEIETIKDFLANHLNESVSEMILAAEGNKAEMKKYVNRFIRKIVVHLSDHFHTILEVMPKKYVGAIKGQSFVVPVIDEDENGNIIENGYEVMQTQDLSLEVNDSDYIIIDKKRKIAFAIDNTVQAHSVTYNREMGEFVYANDYNGGVPLSTETLIGLYLISQSSNEAAVKALNDSFNISFKALRYK